MTDDDCIKRIIKCYLHFKGEATTQMLLSHILEIGYGLRKEYSSRALGNKMGIWSRYSKSGAWFNVEAFDKNGKKYWRLKNDI